MQDLLDASLPQGKPDNPPGFSKDETQVSSEGETKPDKVPETPQNKAVPKTDSFLAVPEYLWKSLNTGSQDELAKKLVAYVVNHRDRAAYGDGFDDAALFAHLDDAERPKLAKSILEQKHGVSNDQSKFQEQRLELVKQAVVSATEVNAHLKAWTTLSQKVVPFLIGSSIAVAVFVALLFVLVANKHINGWEMAVLAFVFALMAVSPATLLLIGRPLKGLDEWTPNKQEKQAEEAVKAEPAKNK